MDATGIVEEPPSPGIDRNDVAGARPDERVMLARRILGGMAATLAVTILAVLLVRVLTWDWLAVGDFGTLRLRTLDVGTSHTPLVGVYSRWGWNHPGPMLFLLMAPALRLTGGAGHGLLLGALLINLAAIVAVLIVARRAGSGVLALVASATAVLVRALGTGELLDPWNPYVLIVALFTAAVSAWRAVLGDRVAAVVFIVAASFAVQSHVEVALSVTLLTVVVVAALVWRARRGATAERRTLALALGVGFLCWLLPMIEEFTSDSGGNLRAIVSFAMHGSGDVNGLRDGVRIVTWFLALPTNWAGGDLLVPKGGASFPVALIGLLVASGWALWRRYRTELALCAVALLLVATAVISCSRISGVAFPYLYRWVLAVAVVVWLAIGGVVLRAVRERWGRPLLDEVVLWSATVVLLLVMLVQGPTTTALEGSETALRKFDSLVEPTLGALHELTPPTLIVVTASGIDGSFAIDMLQRAPGEGLDLRFDAARSFIFGSQRTIDPAAANSQLVLAAGASRDTYLADPTYRLVGAFDPLTPDERHEYETLDAIDWSSRNDGPTDPGPEYRRYRQLAEDFEYLAVFVSDQPPSPEG